MSPERQAEYHRLRLHHRRHARRRGQLGTVLTALSLGLGALEQLARNPLASLAADVLRYLALALAIAAGADAMMSIGWLRGSACVTDLQTQDTT